MRCTSEVTDTQFPFVEDTTPFILVYNEVALGGDLADLKGVERGFDHARTVEKKIDLIERAQRLRAAGVDCSLLACWPGVRHTDTFLVDDLDEASAAFA